MKRLARIFVAMMIAWVVGLTLILASLYFLNGGGDFTMTDITGFGVIFMVASGLLMLLLYLPVLIWLQNKAGTRSSLLRPLVSGLVLNIPVLLVLTLLAGRKMSGLEALTMMVTYVAAGAAFGLAFDWKTKAEIHR